MVPAVGLQADAEAAALAELLHLSHLAERALVTPSYPPPSSHDPPTNQTHHDFIAGPEELLPLILQFLLLRVRQLRPFDSGTLVWKQGRDTGDERRQAAPGRRLLTSEPDWLAQPSEWVWPAWS